MEKHVACLSSDIPFRRKFYSSDCVLWYLRNLLRDLAHPWEGVDGAVPGAVVAPLPVEMHVTCHVSRVTCHDYCHDGINTAAS